MEESPAYKWKTTGGPQYEYLKEIAKENRKNPTMAEKIMWELIRNNKFGFKFRRQHIIGNYIVDFVNLELNLVIEIDGEYHSTFNQKLKDNQRTESLTKQGFTIIRFKNHEVLTDIDSVIDKLTSEINKLSIRG